jgi:hypothetical protein
MWHESDLIGGETDMPQNKTNPPKLPLGVTKIEFESGYSKRMVVHFPCNQFRYNQFSRLFQIGKPFSLSIILGLKDFGTLRGIIHSIEPHKTEILLYFPIESYREWMALYGPK